MVAKSLLADGEVSSQTKSTNLLYSTRLFERPCSPLGRATGRCSPSTMVARRSWTLVRRRAPTNRACSEGFYSSGESWWSFLGRWQEWRWCGWGWPHASEISARAPLRCTSSPTPVGEVERHMSVVEARSEPRLPREAERRRRTPL
jgi:hypothetical protein